MHSRFIQSLVAALAVGAIVAPAAIATVDLRSPDARDAASATRDIRSSPPIDLRSPDARDAARNLTRVSSATTPVEISAPDSGWFDWASAAIGVGALAVLLVAAAGVKTGTRRMHGHVAR
jgi:hypothetical protein